MTFYPHKCSRVELLDHNLLFTYYLAKEIYSNGHGDPNNKDGFATKPFELYTLRSSGQNKVIKHFAKSHSPAQAPGDANAILDIKWEVRGAGDKVVKDVAVIDGEVKQVDRVIKGEKQTKTGRLSVTIPGDHICHFYDRNDVSSFVRSTNPLYFN